MPVLIVDTCQRFCTAVIAEGAAIIAWASDDIGVGHAEHIAPMVSDVLASAEMVSSDITATAATVGPGSFMGVRVGVSFAKGFAAARDLPTTPVTSFSALRFSASDMPKVVVIDARRDQLYIQYENDPPSLVSIDAAQTQFGNLSDCIAVGSGVDLLWKGRASDGPTVPTTDGLAKAVVDAVPGPLSPLYLRAPDAAPAKR